MTLFDIVVVTLFLFFFARGAWKGGVSQIVSIIALVLASSFAFLLYDEIADIFSAFLKPSISLPVTFLLIFSIVFFFIKVAGKFLEKLIKVSMLGWLDRLFGIFCGLLCATVASIMIYIVLAGAFPSTKPHLKRSFTYPFVSKSSKAMFSVFRAKKPLPLEDFPRISVPSGKDIKTYAKEITKNN